MFKRNIIKLLQERDERRSTLFLGAFKAQSTHVHRMDRRVQELELQMNKLLKSDLDSVESDSLLIKRLREQLETLCARNDKLTAQLQDLVRQNIELKSKNAELDREVSRLQGAAAGSCQLDCLVELYKVPKDTEHKIAIVKAIRDFTGCGLRIAVDIVNAAQNGGRTGYSSVMRPYVQILHPDRSKDDGRSYHQRAMDLLNTLYDLGCDVYLASE